MGKAHEKRAEQQFARAGEVTARRILMIGHEWFQERPGGGGRYMQAVAQGLAERGHRITVVVPQMAMCPPETTQWGDVTVLRLPLGESASAWMFHLVSALPTVVRQWGPFDVVHSHFAPVGLVPLWHPALRAARRICQFQGPWAGESQIEGAPPLKVALQRAIERLAYSRCGQFITLSHAFAQLLNRDYGVPPHAISVIPSGIDTARFFPAADRAALRRKLGATPAPLVFTARRLVQRMGLDVLLQAWPSVLSAHPDAQLWVAGEGPLRDSLVNQLTETGLGKSVKLLGRIDDDHLLACHQAADTFVLPTIALEGFGLVTLEALACGTPVVGTREGATPELLAPLDNTLLVPAGDAGELAHGLLNLLSRTDTPALRRACREHVEHHYKWSDALDRLEAVLVGP